MAKNQGEGNREAAREYEERSREFVQSHDVEKEAREAGRDDQAEEKGKARAKEHDPQVHRDYSKPE